MADFVKERMNVKVSVDIDDQLTWAELFRFVDLVRGSGVDPQDQVGLNYDEDRGRFDGLYAYIEPDHLRAGHEGS